MTRFDEALLSDGEVVRASLDDPHRFGLIFDRHVDAVYGYLIRRGGHDLADELTGEIFRVAFEQRRRFDLERTSARPWLYGIATNLMRRHWRTATRRGQAHRRLLTRQSAAVVNELEGVDDSVDAGRHRMALDAALTTLPPRDREPLLLYVWEDLSYSEIAEALGIPVGTVRSRLNRARRRMRAALNDPPPDQPVLRVRWTPSSGHDAYAADT